MNKQTAKHTPGPWTIQHLESKHNLYDDWNVYMVRSSQNVALAQVGHVDRFESERIEANARLIAAAPDLLAACEEAMDWIAADNSGENDAIISFLGNVIAKARGEA